MLFKWSKQGIEKCDKLGFDFGNDTWNEKQ